MARQPTTAQPTNTTRQSTSGDARRSAPQAELPATTFVTGQSIGAIFALCAFTVGIVGGIFSGNGATSVVGRALLAMIVCYPVGLVVGWICQRVVSDHIKAHVEANPVPDLDEHRQHDDAEQAVEAHSADEAEHPLVV